MSYVNMYTNVPRCKVLFIPFSDWPDYSSDDSDTSEVEPILGGASDTSSHDSPAAGVSHDEGRSPSHSAAVSATTSPSDFTAQRILHLFTELGTSNVLETSTSVYMEHSFIHCSQCTGRLLNL